MKKLTQMYKGYMFHPILYKTVTRTSIVAVLMLLLERKLIKARYERIDLYAEIFADIERLEDETEKAVLTYRYLRRYSWEKICVEMGYQWAQMHRIHARALKNFNPTGGYYELLVKKMKDDTQ